MPGGGRDIVVVSPPNLEKSEFARVDAALSAPHAPLNRDWLLARFAEGLQVRLLKAPNEGLVWCQPGKLAWRPIEGVGRTLVIQDLRVAPGALAREGLARLWSAAERFANYYGFVAVVALVGSGPGLVAQDRAPGRGWMSLDTGPDDVRLVGRVLQGPQVLPFLPTDWTQRAAALGPGVVIQTTGESAGLEARAEDTVARVMAQGQRARHDRLAGPDQVRARAVRPGAVYSVVIDGVVAGGPELTVEAILALLRRGAPGQSPS